jgi:phosphoribosylamine--glycine ligase
VIVFHAGTAHQGNQLVTSGGRVMAVTALGENLEQALDCAYAATEHIHFNGMQFRHDIGRTYKEDTA